MIVSGVAPSAACMCGSTTLAIVASITTSTVAAMANAEVTRQAMMIAYVNDFWLMMWALILMLPVVLILSPVRVPRGVAAEPITLSE